MKILYRYLFREILVVSLSTIGVLTFLLVLFNVFKEIFDLLLNEEISLWIIFKLVGLLVPFVLTFTLPWGLLLGVLIVFGRLSHDLELMAIKASGIGLGVIIVPPVLIGFTFSILTFWINASVGPLCRRAYKDVAYDLISNNPMAFFQADKTIDKFEGYRIYVGKKQGTRIDDVYIWQLDSKNNPIRSFRADYGEITFDRVQKRLLVNLHNARQEERAANDPLNPLKVRTGARADEMPLEIPLSSVLDKTKNQKSLGSETLDDIRREVLNPTELPPGGNFTPILTEIQKRAALALSCFTFVIMGIPLAIKTHRRETSIGVILSLVVVVAYYFVIVLADALKRNPHIYPELIIWLPNLSFQALGFYLIWRVNKR